MCNRQIDVRSPPRLVNAKWDRKFSWEVLKLTVIYIRTSETGQVWGTVIYRIYLLQNSIGKWSRLLAAVYRNTVNSRKLQIFEKLLDKSEIDKFCKRKTFTVHKTYCQHNAAENAWGLQKLIIVFKNCRSRRIQFTLSQTEMPWYQHSNV